MLAWGPMKGYTGGRYTMEEAAVKAEAKGYKWAALELDDVETGQYNRDHWDEFAMHFRLHNMQVGPWFTEGGHIYKTPGDADFAIAEMEGPGDYEGIVNVINGVGGGPLPTCSLAIVTNFNTPLLSHAAAKPLIDAGFSCLTEAYMNDNPNADPDGLDQIARSLGWPTSQPVFGVYPTASVPNPVPLYDPWKNWPGVDYLGEYVM